MNLNIHTIKIIVTLFVITLPTLTTTAFQTIEELKPLYIDFEASLHNGFSEQEYADFFKKKPYKDQIQLLKNLYEQSNFLKKIEELTTKKNIIEQKIPKIIHQIWLGSPFPECYKKYQESWIRLHPDWEYKLWTDADVLSFNLINKEAFNEGKTWAEKANIFRYEIIERYGGVYVDTDFQALLPLDILHYFYEFYAGMATINRLTMINNGMIGAIPNHPILKRCIQKIKDKKGYGISQIWKNGTVFFSNTIIEYCKTKQLNDLASLAILPPSYLYPLPSKKLSIDNYILPSSFAVHYWASKWNGIHAKNWPLSGNKEYKEKLSVP